MEWYMIMAIYFTLHDDITTLKDNFEDLLLENHFIIKIIKMVFYMIIQYHGNQLKNSHKILKIR